MGDPSEERGKIREKMEAKARETGADDEAAAIWNEAVLETAAELRLDSLMEKLADGFDTGGDLIRRIDALFDRQILSCNFHIRLMYMMQTSKRHGSNCSLVFI